MAPLVRTTREYFFSDADLKRMLGLPAHLVILSLDRPELVQGTVVAVYDPKETTTCPRK